MEEKNISESTKDEYESIDDEIWKLYSGPKHQKIKESDTQYLRYVQLLLKKVGIFSEKPHKHTIVFCTECYSFISLEGKKLVELGHPNHFLVSTRKLCKQEKIKDLQSFLEWNKRTPMIVKYKGRETKMSIAPTYNCFHKSSEYDGIESNQEKRSYVLALERKVRKLEEENGLLRKRLLISHWYQFNLEDSDPRKSIS